MSDTRPKEPGERRYSFFSHTDCAYFPCHKTDDPAGFNCLFCYCPLYALGTGCGGDYTYTAAGIKDCSNCLLPHTRAGYDAVVRRFPELAALAAQKK